MRPALTERPFGEAPLRFPAVPKWDRQDRAWLLTPLPNCPAATGLPLLWPHSRSQPLVSPVGAAGAPSEAAAPGARATCALLEPRVELQERRAGK